MSLVYFENNNKIASIIILLLTLLCYTNHLLPALKNESTLIVLPALILKHRLLNENSLISKNIKRQSIHLYLSENKK